MASASSSLKSTSNLPFSQFNPNGQFLWALSTFGNLQKIVGKVALTSVEPGFPLGVFIIDLQRPAVSHLKWSIGTWAFPFLFKSPCTVRQMSGLSPSGSNFMMPHCEKSGTCREAPKPAVFFVCFCNVAESVTSAQDADFGSGPGRPSPACVGACRWASVLLAEGLQDGACCL